jgi:hypothetical protein
VVNKFLKYGGSEVRNKVLKIMNMIFEKGEVPKDFRQPIIKPLYEKGDKHCARGRIFTHRSGQNKNMD